MSDPARRRLIRFLARGGSVVREDVGGVIGVRCCGAARSGREFEGAAFDRLRETGCTFKGKARTLERTPGPAEIYRFTPLPPETSDA